jgi:phosphopantetheinyl transferase
MGVILTRIVEGPAELGIWNITEDTGQLLQHLNLSDTEQRLLHMFKTELRQKQWLSYRRLIRELISPQRYPVHYDESGKPYLAGSEWNISVTHTENYAGVIISRDVKVGIDMEKLKPRIDRVKEKFLSEEELSAIPQEKKLEYLTLAWCAKEAVYKLHGWRNLDFRKNIRVQFPSHEGTSIFYCKVSLPAGNFNSKLFYEMKDDLVIVWAIEDKAGRRN